MEALWFGVLEKMNEKKSNAWKMGKRNLRINRMGVDKRSDITPCSLEETVDNIKVRLQARRHI